MNLALAFGNANKGQSVCHWHLTGESSRLLSLFIVDLLHVKVIGALKNLHTEMAGLTFKRYSRTNIFSVDARRHPKNKYTVQGWESSEIGGSGREIPHVHSTDWIGLTGGSHEKYFFIHLILHILLPLNIYPHKFHCLIHVYLHLCSLFLDF